MTAFIFTFLLVATLEATSEKKSTEPVPESEVPEEPDMCVGCDDKEKEQPPEDPDPVVIDIVVDPITGNVQYVIRGIEIK
tara:strand:+ start:206 stop:445 length:240 start_codon:yes stop_codon:yes gene_type:complete